MKEKIMVLAAFQKKLCLTVIKIGLWNSKLLSEFFCRSSSFKTVTFFFCRDKNPRRLL